LTIGDVTLTVDPAASHRMLSGSGHDPIIQERPYEATRAARSRATNHAKANPTRGSLVPAEAT
jgi:hypothetical protein